MLKSKLNYTENEYEILKLMNETNIIRAFRKNFLHERNFQY